MKLESGHRLWRWGFAALALVIVGGGLFWASQSPLIAIQTIQVDGNNAVTTDQIMQRVGPMLEGRSLLSLSFSDVNQALGEFPFVASVDIERSFPHTIKLHVHERRPLAWLEADRQALLLSATGYVLKQQPAPDAGYPVLTAKNPCTAGEGGQVSCGDVMNGVSFLADIPVSFTQEITAVSVSDGDINAKTKSNVNIHFGTLDDYDIKFEVLEQLIARSMAAGKTVSVDVSVPDRPVTKS